MSPNASHRVRPGLSSAASLITTLLISFDQEVLNQHLNLVTPEYPFFESPCPYPRADPPATHTVGRGRALNHNDYGSELTSRRSDRPAERTNHGPRWLRSLHDRRGRPSSVYGF